MNILGGISNGSINPNLWSILCRVRESICIFAFGENYGVATVQPGASNSPPDGYRNQKTLVALRFFDAAKKSGTNAVRAIPLVHKQNLKNHYCSTNISKEKCTAMTPVFYDVNDVQDVLRCKESKAYRVIRECNKELQALGFIIHPGKVSAEYFLTRHGLTKEGIVQ